MRLSIHRKNQFFEFKNFLKILINKPAVLTFLNVNEIFVRTLLSLKNTQKMCNHFSALKIVDYPAQ